MTIGSTALGAGATVTAPVAALSGAVLAGPLLPEGVGRGLKTVGSGSSDPREVLRSSASVAGRSSEKGVVLRRTRPCPQPKRRRLGGSPDAWLVSSYSQGQDSWISSRPRSVPSNLQESISK